jgi:hypothetical protein
VAVEWTRRFSQPDKRLRGLELYEFDTATGLVREIRGYFAAARDFEKGRLELIDFDYAGRGYSTIP